MSRAGRVPVAAAVCLRYILVIHHIKQGACPGTGLGRAHGIGAVQARKEPRRHHVTAALLTHSSSSALRGISRRILPWYHSNCARGACGLQAVGILREAAPAQKYQSMMRRKVAGLTADVQVDEGLTLYEIAQSMYTWSFGRHFSCNAATYFSLPPSSRSHVAA